MVEMGVVIGGRQPAAYVSSNSRSTRPTETRERATDTGADSESTRADSSGRPADSPGSSGAHSSAAGLATTERWVVQAVETPASLDPLAPTAVVFDRLDSAAIRRWVRAADSVASVERIVVVVETRAGLCAAYGAGATDVVVATDGPAIEAVRERLATCLGSGTAPHASADANGSSDPDDLSNPDDSSGGGDSPPGGSDRWSAADSSDTAVQLLRATSLGVLRVDDRWRVRETAGDVSVVGCEAGDHLWQPLSTVDGAAAWRLRTARLTGEPTRTRWRVADERLTAVCLPLDGELLIALRPDGRDEQAHAERTRLGHLLETIDDGIYTLDEQFRIQSVNEAVMELTGYDRARLEGAHASLLAPDDTLAEAAAAIERLRTGAARTDSLETELACADGSRVPVETRFSAATAPDGSPIYVGVVRDVTDQRRYERTLRALNRSAQTLLEATDDRSVWEQLVETGRSVLGFDAVAAYRFDADEASLRPVAVCVDDAVDRQPAGEQPTPDDSSIPDDSSAADDPSPTENERRPTDVGVEPTAGTDGGVRARPLAESSIGWQQFVAGEQTTIPADSTPHEFVPADDHALYVPIDDHGLLVAAVSEAALSDSTAELVELLTANGRAALDRLERESRLTRHQRELATHTTELARVNRINELVRDLNAALVDAGSRSAVESAICDRLVRADHVVGAWIGTPSENADGDLRPRTVAGLDEYVTDQLGDPRVTDEPAVVAARTGERTVVSNAAERLRAEPWAERALAHDVQAVAALPIRADGVSFGVLAVYADEPGTFDPPAADVLGEFAGTIAAAIDRAQTKRTLAGGEVSVVQLRVAAGDLPMPRMAAAVETPVTVRSATPTATGSQVCLTADEPLSPDRLVTVSGVTDVERVGETTCAVRLREPTLPTRIAAHGGATTTLEATEDGVDATVELPTGGVGAFLDALRAEYASVELTARRSTRSGRLPAAFYQQAAEKLTDRQLDVLRTSYAMGYYEWPREASGQQVADSLDIAQPTFANHLRTAQRKLFELFFDRES